MHHSRRVLVATISLLLLTLGRHPAAQMAHAQANRLCFPNVPGITNCIDGRFREYWQQNGGLAVFGYPITAASSERNQDTEDSYLTQWFERNRFELHPENKAPYDVLLGRLGDDRLKQQGRDWFTFPKALAVHPHFFPETGHAITFEAFWSYWSSHGLDLDGRPGVSHEESVALFGLPISEARLETNASGDTVLAQWFERARLESHGQKGILLGLLGTEVRGNSTTQSLR